MHPHPTNVRREVGEDGIVEVIQYLIRPIFLKPIEPTDFEEDLILIVLEVEVVWIIIMVED